MSHPAHIQKNLKGQQPENILRLVFWETTAGCNLACIHCRRLTLAKDLMPEDLTTDESKNLIEQIKSFSNAVLVLSGGEPLFRKDIFEIARYGSDIGLPVALATNGTLVDKIIAKKIVDSGVKRVSISIDGADAETHDKFRALTGSFNKALEGFKNLKELNMSLQINVSIAKHNSKQLPDIISLAENFGADALHIFMLVPVGCGVEIKEDQQLPADEYEELLNWFYEKSLQTKLQLKATCAPHYYRIVRQRKAEERKQGIVNQPLNPQNDNPLHTFTKGCLAATAICFVSHKGEVFPCGYLPVSAGNVRKTNLKEIWENSELFHNLRNPDNLKGKCGACEYKIVCEGCRARAFGEKGDYLEEEPYCIYTPRKSLG